MNRKDFLSKTIPLSLATMPFTQIMDEADKLVKIPRYLREGDTVGICCPSGPITMEEIQPALRVLKSWGYEVVIGKTVGMKDFTYAGPDTERIKDMQAMLDDPKIKAILFGRGGYGAVRIIDKLDFTKFAASPKWLIGFSDATVFHAHLNRNYGIASIHSKMCNSFPDDFNSADREVRDSIHSIKACLINEEIGYPVTVNPNNKNGTGEGILIGGNLAILQNLAGSRSDINTQGKILFIEEAEEYLYNIDRMLWNLKRSGKLSGLKGLIVGGFTHLRPDDPGEEFGKSVYEMVLEKVKEYHYPVCFDFPVGHQKSNYAMKCGVKHRFSVKMDGVSLIELKMKN